MLLSKNAMNRFYLAAVLLGLCASLAYGQWQRQSIGTDADFRGLCAVSANVAWVSGTKGTYGRTTDAGKTWSVGTVPGAAKLDFRDVEGFGETTAYLLSAGPGEDSRIYKTADGGKTWILQFKNPDAWAKDRWVAVGTSGSNFSQNNGATWKPLDQKNYNSVGFTSTGEGWAVGPRGRIAKFAKTQSE